MAERAVSVDPKDPTPPFEQVRRQLGELIRGGVLRPGDRLPPLRQLAGDLGLAVGTVGRAYAELETEGLVVSRRGAGTRVADVALAPPDVDALAREFLQRTAGLGIAPEAALEAVRRAAGPQP